MRGKHGEINVFEKKKKKKKNSKNRWFFNMDIPYYQYKNSLYGDLRILPRIPMLVRHIFILTLKQREMHGCVVSTVATDALVLKHQAISIHNAD